MSRPSRPSLFLRRASLAALSVLCLSPALLLAGCGGGGAAGSGLPTGDNTNPGDGSTLSSDPVACRDYKPAVTITSVSPGRGPIAGGTTVTIRGTGFRKCSPTIPGLNFSDAGPGEVKSWTDSEIVAVTPSVPDPRTSNVRVTQTNPSGYNPNKPPSFLGQTGWNEPGEAARFAYE